MTENRWKRKARSLALLAEDQRGKPEGETVSELQEAHPEWDGVLIVIAGDSHNNLWDESITKLDETGNRNGYCWIRQNSLTQKPIEVYCDIPIVYNQRLVIGRLKSEPNLLRVLSTL